MNKITTSRNAAASTKRPRRMARLPEQSATTPAKADAAEQARDGSLLPSATSAILATTAEPASPSPTKASLVLDLLRRERGATLAELVDATGWLPHTVRAHLTGLRKKGRTIEKSKRDGATCYRIGKAS